MRVSDGVHLQLYRRAATKLVTTHITNLRPARLLRSLAGSRGRHQTVGSNPVRTSRTLTSILDSRRQTKEQHRLTLNRRGSTQDPEIHLGYRSETDPNHFWGTVHRLAPTTPGVPFRDRLEIHLKYHSETGPKHT